MRNTNTIFHAMKAVFDENMYPRCPDGSRVNIPAIETGVLPLRIVIWITEITTFLRKMVINHHHHRLRKLIPYGVITVLSGLMCLILLMEVVGLIPNPLVNLRLLG